MKEGKYFSLSAARALPADRPALRRRTILAKDKKPMIALSRFTQLLALLVVMFLLSACGGGGGSSDQSTTFDIEGRVLNGPLDGSAVQVFGTNGGSALGTATTDGDGRYAAQVSRAGPYRLRASGGKLNGIDYTGVLEAACASGSNCFVTPYTTAILRLVGDHGFNTGDAASHLATSLEFDGDPFAGDVPAEAFDLDAARQAIAGGDGLAEWVASMVAWATSEDAEPPPGVGGSGSSGPPGAPGEPGEPDPVPPPAPDPDPEPVPDPDPDPVVPGTYNVSAIAGAGGSISPTSQAVAYGATATFTVTPEPGYSIDSVSGCGGGLEGNTYTTGITTAACTVSAAFFVTCEGSDGTERHFTYSWSLETEKVTFTNDNSCDDLFVWATRAVGGGGNSIIDVAKEVSPGEAIVMAAGVPFYLSWKPHVIYSLVNGDTYEYMPIQAGTSIEHNFEVLLLDHADYHLGQLARFSEMFIIGRDEATRGECHSFSWLDRDQGRFQIAPNQTAEGAFCYVGNIEGYTISGDQEWLPPLRYFVTEKNRWEVHQVERALTAVVH